MRGTKSKFVSRPARRAGKANAVDSPSVRHADELMELAVDAAQSRQLPDFLHRFAQRSARMLNAAWGAVLVFRGRETDDVLRATAFIGRWLTFFPDPFNSLAGAAHEFHQAFRHACDGVDRVGDNIFRCRKGALSRLHERVFVCVGSRNFL